MMWGLYAAVVGELAVCVFLFQAEDGIRDRNVTGVQTCALPISDAVIDCAGAQVSPDQGLSMLKQAEGRLVLVALFERPPTLDFNQVVRKQVTVHGSWAWTGDDFRRAIEP